MRKTREYLPFIAAQLLRASISSQKTFPNIDDPQHDLQPLPGSLITSFFIHSQTMTQTISPLRVIPSALSSYPFIVLLLNEQNNFPRIPSQPLSSAAQKKRKTFGRNFPLLLIDLACIESICCHSSVIFSTAVIMNVSELSGAKFDHFVPLSHASGLSFGPETATNVSMEENRQKREKIH